MFCISESLGLQQDKRHCMTLKMDFCGHLDRRGMVWPNGSFADNPDPRSQRLISPIRRDK
jgi:hypothetical protein